MLYMLKAWSLCVLVIFLVFLIWGWVFLGDLDGFLVISWMIIFLGFWGRRKRRMWRDSGVSTESFYQVRPECTDVPKTKFKIRVRSWFFHFFFYVCMYYLFIGCILLDVIMMHCFFGYKMIEWNVGDLAVPVWFCVSWAF